MTYTASASAFRFTWLELDSPTVEFHGVLTLDGFAALRAFDLSPIIQIRPVSQADLRVLNELHLAPFPSGVFGWPSTGWWVADFKVLNRRGGLVEVNGVYEHHEALTLALRAFKEGGCNVRMGYTTAVSPLQETGIIQGGLAERLSSLHSTYSISEEEIPRLVEFWKRFESLIHKADHYLQASVRRLRTAGGRHQREDALVDFVIGLESLLQYGKCGRWWRNFV